MSDLTPREARMLFGLLKVREAQIRAVLKHVALFVEQEPGDRNAAMLGRAKLGSVILTEPKITAQVTDRDLFIKHVAEHRPTEVEQVTVVRPAYETALLAEMTQRGALVDRDGQEVPGVTLRPASTPSQRWEPADNAAELLACVEPHDLPEVEGVDLAGILGVRPAPALERADQPQESS